MFYTSQKSGNNKQQHRFSALPSVDTGDWSHCQNLGCGASFGTKHFSYFNFPLCLVLFLITSITGLFQGQGALAVGMRLQLMGPSRSLELICHICFVPCRSLNMDFENQDKEKDNSSAAGSFNGNSTNNSKGQLYSLPFVLHLSAAPPASPEGGSELLHCRFTRSQALSGHSPPRSAQTLLSTAGSPHGSWI